LAPGRGFLPGTTKPSGVLFTKFAR
jgi:hypothetical protein